MKFSSALTTVFLLNSEHTKSFLVNPNLNVKTRLHSTKEEIQFYNSLTNTKEHFKPSHDPNVSMYTCGPTVYDFAHIGNFRAFLTYDILKRVLTYFGYDVKHICNLTDIDDKIIARCNRENISLKELTRRYENFFMEDLAALNIIPASAYPRATDHIEEMVDLVEDLYRKGLAYRSEEGSWYFNVGKKEGYGKQLVNLDVENMIGASDADEYDKEGVRDFALWKAYKPNSDREDAVWDTALGKGRPGWHLECSAMARKYLGDQTIDIHCGGIDLKFPHHENEIAQSEGATSNKFCNCWLHNGFVNIGDEKMSKSKGNFLTLRTACTTSDDIRAYRYLVVSSHYRNPLTFTQNTLNASKNALKRIDKVRLQLSHILNEKHVKAPQSVITNQVQKHLHDFNLALVDDLSMPRAAASLFSIVKLAESHFKTCDDAYDIDGLTAIQYALDKMDEVFGIFYTVPSTHEERLDDVVPDEVIQLVNQRIEAKKAKEWELADSLRNQVTQLGYTIKDVKGGEPIVTRL